jgi:DNA-binding NarL/FixJ family response regulator
LLAARSLIAVAIVAVGAQAPHSSEPGTPKRNLMADLRAQGSDSTENASRELLWRALDLAHRCGARALAERARSELIAAGGRPRRFVISGLDSLTPSERRVAQMAASGLSNRDIAQNLFITARTVEGHLTHTYEKLAITSGEQLRAALAARHNATTVPASTLR